MGIIHSGRINVSSNEIGTNEVPVVWFSSNQNLEMTFREVAMQREDGSFLRARNVAEHRMLGRGLYRIGAPIASLTRYVETLQRAKIGFGRRRKLEKAAAQVGATPYEWFSAFQPFPLTSAVSIENFNGNKWVQFDLKDGAEKVLEELRDTVPLLKALLETVRSDPAPVGAERLW